VIVADTHAVLWWFLSPSQLTPSARLALASGSINVSIISFMEITNLARRGRITLPLRVDEWLKAMLRLPGVSLTSLTLEIAVAAGLLGDPIRDPADRIIVATAQQLKLPLVTGDARIRSANVVETIW
jgi:PIN domain nuclease of toxin-antitoxin system